MKRLVTKEKASENGSFDLLTALQEDNVKHMETAQLLGHEFYVMTPTPTELLDLKQLAGKLAKTAEKDDNSPISPSQRAELGSMYGDSAPDLDRYTFAQANYEIARLQTFTVLLMGGSIRNEAGKPLYKDQKNPETYLKDLSRAIYTNATAKASVNDALARYRDAMTPDEGNGLTSDN